MTKLTSFQRTSPQNYPDDAILARVKILGQYLDKQVLMWSP